MSIPTLYCRKSSLWCFNLWALLLMGVIVQFCVALPLHAANKGGFAGGVTPSRFELTASAGEIVKRSLSIYNLGSRPNQFQINTEDWRYTVKEGLKFYDELQENSCRPWVRLERHKINIPPSAKIPRKFRFEMHVPQQTPAQECRFAIVLSSLGEAYNTLLNDGGISLPVTGRIAIIVYLMIGDAKPDFVLDSLMVIKENNQWVPVVKVLNNGLAHGRLDGELTGTDAQGNTLDLFISNIPILPNQTRLITLSPDEAYSKKQGFIHYPLTLTGKIYTDDKTFNIDTTLAPK